MGAMPLARRILLHGQWATPVRLAALRRAMPEDAYLAELAALGAQPATRRRT